MPTVLKVGSYRFFFYAQDRNEPAHIHVERENKIAKFWLEPVRLQKSGGYSRLEITKIHNIIKDNHNILIEAWNEYFKS